MPPPCRFVLRDGACAPHGHALHRAGRHRHDLHDGAGWQGRWRNSPGSQDLSHDGGRGRLGEGAAAPGEHGRSRPAAAAILSAPTAGAGRRRQRRWHARGGR